MEEKMREVATSLNDYNPNLQRLDVFGDPGDLEADHEWPKLDHINDFPVYKRVKLSSILYKLNGDKTPLMGIQLKFTNGVKSPCF